MELKDCNYCHKTDTLQTTLAEQNVTLETIETGAGETDAPTISKLKAQVHKGAILPLKKHTLVS
jgi:hypothetical protein